MSTKAKWRRWLRTIDAQILDPIREDKLIFEQYCALVQGNESASSPGNFHVWVLANHGRSVMLQVRRLVDTDKRTYSLRRLLGSIAEHHDLITRRAFVLSYPRHHRDIAAARWRQHTDAANGDSLPKSVPIQDLEALERASAKICNIVNKDIAHLDRVRRKRLTSWKEVYRTIGQQVSLAAKYGDLVGQHVADDLDNFVIAYDWMSIFDRPWRNATTQPTVVESEQSD